MNNVTANMNIYFEEPKWICEYFRKTGNEIEVCKLSFDFEPLSSDIYKYFLNNFNKLIYIMNIFMKKIKNIYLKDKNGIKYILLNTNIKFLAL